MVREVICPREQWEANAAGGKDLLTVLMGWEVKITAYEVAIKDHAPEPVKTTLCPAPLDQRNSVNALKFLMPEASYILPEVFEG